jgi:hypothetical protein
MVMHLQISLKMGSLCPAEHVLPCISVCQLVSKNESMIAVSAIIFM